MIFLSQHFTLAEMTRSQTASRRGIDNTPPPAAITNLRRLCVEVLEPLRAMVRRPLHVTSGYRSPMLNEIVGGNRKGSHPRGEAADIECPGFDNLQLARLIRDGGLIFDQLLLEFYVAGVPSSGWVHVSRKEAGNRMEVLTAFTEGGGDIRYEDGLPSGQLPPQ